MRRNINTATSIRTLQHALTKRTGTEHTRPPSHERKCDPSSMRCAPRLLSSWRCNRCAQSWSVKLRPPSSNWRCVRVSIVRRQLLACRDLFDGGAACDNTHMAESAQTPLTASLGFRFFLPRNYRAVRECACASVRLEQDKSNNARCNGVRRRRKTHTSSRNSSRPGVCLCVFPGNIVKPSPQRLRNYCVMFQTRDRLHFLTQQNVLARRIVEATRASLAM